MDLLTKYTLLIFLVICRAGGRHCHKPLYINYLAGGRKFGASLARRLLLEQAGRSGGLQIKTENLEKKNEKHQKHHRSISFGRNVER
jgi:hypothetical protein